MGLVIAHMYMPDQKRCAHCIKSCVTVIPSESNHESRSQIKKAKHPVYSIYIAYSLELRCIALPIDSSQTARVKKAWQAIGSGRSSFASWCVRILLMRRLRVYCLSSLVNICMLRLYAVYMLHKVSSLCMPPYACHELAGVAAYDY